MEPNPEGFCHFVAIIGMAIALIGIVDAITKMLSRTANTLFTLITSQNYMPDYVIIRLGK
jgi:hypothetical protein